MTKNQERLLVAGLTGIIFATAVAGYAMNLGKNTPARAQSVPLGEAGEITAAPVSPVSPRP